MRTSSFLYNPTFARVQLGDRFGHPVDGLQGVPVDAGLVKADIARQSPAVKLRRLGVDVSAKGNKNGSGILDYIKWMFTRYNKTGCRFLTVDANLDAVPSYEKTASGS